jgi:glycosyltransferase involved in cell wall biosynthesis
MGWQAASEPVLSPEDREFYKAHSSTKQSVFQENPLPLVSAIMPTADRRSFVPRAIEYFRRQTYPNKELIIVDDGADPIGDLIAQRENIIYLRPPSRLSVGAKRNLACEKAHGEIILHWDDDDWHAPHRISYQVDALLNSGTDVCGINNMFFLNQSDGRTWQYSYPTNQRFWLSGSTLCYRKSFWAKHRFPEVNVGEDARFIWAGSRARMTLLSDSTFHVGIIHKGNVSPKQTRGVYWKPCPADTIRGILKEDWSFYQSGTSQTLT